MLGHAAQAEVVQAELPPEDMALALLGAARQIAQGLEAAHQRDALAGGDIAHPIHDPVVIRVRRDARRVERIDQHHVDPVGFEPRHGLVQGLGEGGGIDPRDGIVGADLPHDEVRLGIGHEAAQPLGGAGGDLAGQAAMVDHHVDMRHGLFQRRFELHGIGGGGAGGRRAADGQDAQHVPLLQRRLRGREARDAVELRARHPAFERGRRHARFLRGGGDDAQAEGDDDAPHARGFGGLRERHSTNHAVIPNATRPQPATVMSTSNPPPVWKRTSWPIRLNSDPIEKTAREFLPRPDRNPTIQPIRGAINA